jgi:DNA-binding transcriptional regulator GbsR (MarR family)
MSDSKEPNSLPIADIGFEVDLAKKRSSDEIEKLRELNQTLVM